jgi:hypothetical protein
MYSLAGECCCCCSVAKGVMMTCNQAVFLHNRRNAYIDTDWWEGCRDVRTKFHKDWFGHLNVHIDAYTDSGRMELA